MTTHVYSYTCYGLLLHSEIPCPELTAVPFDGARVPDVWIRQDDVPLTLPDRKMLVRFDRDPHSNLRRRNFKYYREFHVAPNLLLVTVEQFARFMIRNGSEILVEYAPESADKPGFQFMFDSCVAALLYQRGVLVLHGSAVDTPRGVIAFTGLSGSGKSTLAAALHAKGASVFGDDLAPIVLDKEKHPVVLPGPSQLKLWKDGVVPLGLPVNGLQRAQPDEEKYIVPLFDEPPRVPRPLYAVYALDFATNDGVTLAPLARNEAFTVMLEHTFRAREYRAIGGIKGRFEIAAETAKQTEVFRLLRPANHPTLAEVVELIQQGI